MKLKILEFRAGKFDNGFYLIPGFKITSSEFTKGVFIIEFSFFKWAIGWKIFYKN